MPRESQELMLNDENLLQICLDLHMSSTGSSDPLDDDTYNRYVLCLEQAVVHWKSEAWWSELFDNAVLNLVKNTLTSIKYQKEFEKYV
jgi:hypothetical protein